MSTFPIITKLGGKDAALEKIKLQGFEKGDDAFRMWHARSRIPGDAVKLLMRAADQEAISYSANDFELEATEAAQ